MKKILYILCFCVGLGSYSNAATELKSGGALDWYGYQSLIDTEVYTNDNSDDGDDDVFRKRRHKRRRKLRPKPRHGFGK